MTSHYNIVTQAIHCRQHKSLVCWLFGGIPQELDIPEREREVSCQLSFTSIKLSTATFAVPAMHL